MVEEGFLDPHLLFLVYFLLDTIEQRAGLPSAPLPFSEYTAATAAAAAPVTVCCHRHHRRRRRSCHRRSCYCCHRCRLRTCHRCHPQPGLLRHAASSCATQVCSAMHCRLTAHTTACRSSAHDVRSSATLSLNETESYQRDSPPPLYSHGPAPLLLCRGPSLLLPQASNGRQLIATRLHRPAQHPVPALPPPTLRQARWRHASGEHPLGQ